MGEVWEELFCSISLFQMSPDVSPGYWRNPGSWRRSGVIYVTVTLLLLCQNPPGPLSPLKSQDGATATPQRIWGQRGGTGCWLFP